MKYDKIAESYISMISEMAVPSHAINNMTFWHGTPNRQNLNSILTNGIVGSDKVSKSSMTPVHGANYITPHLSYAAIYAIGGDLLGTSHAERDIANPKYGDSGYICKIHGHHLKDIQPDEDSIGELLYNKNAPNWLHNLASKHLSVKTIRDIDNGEYHVWARSGKTLVKKMTDNQKLDLILNHNTHIAHFGTLHPDEIYELPRVNVKHVSKDASNIFDHMTRIR